MNINGNDFDEVDEQPGPHVCNILGQGAGCSVCHTSNYPGDCRHCGLASFDSAHAAFIDGEANPGYWHDYSRPDHAPMCHCGNARQGTEHLCYRPVNRFRVLSGLADPGEYTPV